MHDVIIVIYFSRLRIFLPDRTYTRPDRTWSKRSWWNHSFYYQSPSKSNRENHDHDTIINFSLLVILTGVVARPDEPDNKQHDQRARHDQKVFSVEQVLSSLIIHRVPGAACNRGVLTSISPNLSVTGWIHHKTSLSTYSHLMLGR